jgi:hypothetical protein
MAVTNDFRDFGILPIELPPPPPVVRASFSGGHVFGQYLATGIMSCFGIGMGVLFAFTLPTPLNVVAPLAAAGLFGLLVYFATRNDYRWIELTGTRLTAKHLYTGRTVVRDVSEIDDLLTHVVQVRTAAVVLTEKLIGRVRAVQVRFRDGRTPLTIQRRDPTMRNARELVEAIMFRMAEAGELDSEVVNFDGRPLVRRVFRKGATAGPPPAPGGAFSSRPR